MHPHFARGVQKMTTRPTPQRLLTVAKTRASIFETSWNPLGLRTGAKYFKRRLVGPAMNEYYPARWSISSINRMLPGGKGSAGASGRVHEMGEKLVDLVRVERETDLARRKARGKGAPKKARTKEESRRAGRKR